jgi:hypothetical protein
MACEVVMPFESEFEAQERNSQEERHQAALDQTPRIAQANKGDPGRVHQTARDEDPRIERADPKLRFARAGIEPGLIPMPGVDPA